MLTNCGEEKRHGRHWGGHAHVDTKIAQMDCKSFVSCWMEVTKKKLWFARMERFPHLNVSLLLRPEGADADKMFGRKTALGCAIKKGDREIVATLLDQGCDRDKVFIQNQWSPLGYAIQKGQTEIACLLIERGADKDKVFSASKWTPLGLALQKDNHLIASLLIARGADKEKTFGKLMRTPLGLAIHKRQIDIISLLIDNGADKERVCCCNGYTPLALAIHKDDAELVHLFLCAGADAKRSFKIDGKAYTPLEYAKAFHREKVIDVLAQFISKSSAVLAPLKQRNQVHNVIDLDKSSGLENTTMEGQLKQYRKTISELQTQVKHLQQQLASSREVFRWRHNEVLLDAFQIEYDGRCCSLFQ